jgi:hypothetical protein
MKMNTHSMRVGTSLFVAATALAACQNDAIDEKTLVRQAALNAEAVVHESGLAMAYTVADDGTVKKVMGSTTSTASTVAAPMMPAGMPTAMLRAMVGPGVTSQLTGTVMPSMMTTEEQFDQAGADLKRALMERVLVDSNFESKTNDTATYLLHPDPTCRPLPQDTDPPGFLPPISASCQDDFTKVEVRIAVKGDGDGARLTIQIGPARLELASFVIHSDEIALEVDLPKAKTASDYIYQQLPDGSPTGTYDRLAGKLRGSLKKVAPQRVTASLSILSALDIASTGGAELTSAAANPLMAFTSDGSAKTAELQLGLGATEIGTNWDPQGMGLSNRDLHVAIGGLYGKVGLDENAKHIVLTDVGIAESKITARGVTIVDLNLNADSMRRFSGKVTANADSTARLEITPKFDLSLAFDYNAVAADFSSPPDALVAHDTYGVTLGNAGATTIIEEVKSTATFSGGIKMVAGMLKLSAASVPAETVTVPEGKCLTSRNPAPAGSNTILGQLVAADCP